MPPHAHSNSFKRTFVIQLSHGRYEVSSSVIEEGAVVGEDAELPPITVHYYCQGRSLRRRLRKKVPLLLSIRVT